MADRRVRAIFEVQITNAQRGLKTLSGEAKKAEKDVDALGKTLDGLGKKRTQLDLDISKAQKKRDTLEQELEILSRMDPSPKVDADTARAEKALDDVNSRIRALEGMRAEVDVQADTARAEAGLSDIEGHTNRLDGRGATVRVDADTSKAETALDGLVDAAEDAGEEAGEKAGEPIGEGIAGAIGRLAGKASIAGAALALGKVIGSGINEGIQSELRVDLLAAGTGLDAATAKRAGDAAATAYRSGFGESKDELAAILQQAFRAGIMDDGTTDAAMQSFLQKVTTAADLWEADMGMTVEAVGLLLRNDLANDADQAFDIIYAAQQRISADDFMETLREYSVQFQMLGIDAETFGGLAAQAFDAGAYDTDKIADSIKELGIKLRETTDEAMPTAQALTKLGLDWEDVVDGFNAGGPRAVAAMDDVFDAMRRAEEQGTLTGDIVTNLFGGPGEDLGNAALLAMDLDTATEALYGMADGAGYADNIITTATSNWSTGIETAKRSLLDVPYMVESVYDANAQARDVFRQALEGAATGQSELEGASQSLYDALLTTTYATGGLLDATVEAADAQGDFESATDGVNDELGVQSELLETVIDGQRRLSGITMTAVEAEGEFHQSVRDATDALAENGQTLDVTTEAGLANMEALHGIADAGWDHIDALREQDASEADLQSSMRRTREQLVASMIQMGASTEEAEAYADSLGLIPSTITTTVKLDTAQAGRDLSNFIRNNSGKVIGIRAQVTGIGSLEARADGGWVARGRADGGWVPGAPSDSDNVLWPTTLPGRAGGGSLYQPLAGGEYVVNARSAGVNAALLEAINASRGPLTLSPASFEASLVGARVEIGPDGIGRFVDGRIEVREADRLRQIRAGG